MKKVIEKYNISYLVGFLIMCLAVLWFLYCTAAHLRIYNLMWLICSLITARAMFVNIKKGARPNAYEYGKAVKDWKRRKKAAKEAGVDFDEKFPARPDKMGEYISAYFIFYFVSLFAVIGLSLLLYALIPFHWQHEYKGERPQTIGEINFFPEDIPKGAKNVKWIVMPSFLQATGHCVLIFNADDGYIEELVSKYESKAVETERYYNSKRHFASGFGENSVLYTMYEKKDSNHPWYEGFVVDKEKNKAAFFAGSLGQYWAY
ncbi:MAG: hypothetical protein IJR59_05630 [Firmicutes bacterium]|nr:hypothetical protein [Bacillota bacterium]